MRKQCFRKCISFRGINFSYEKGIIPKSKNVLAHSYYFFSNYLFFFLSNKMLAYTFIGIVTYSYIHLTNIHTQAYAIRQFIIVRWTAVFIEITLSTVKYEYSVNQNATRQSIKDAEG